MSKSMDAFYEIIGADIESQEQRLEYLGVWTQAWDAAVQRVGMIELMPCGHLTRYAVHAEAGTSFCALCEVEASRQKIYEANEQAAASQKSWEIWHAETKLARNKLDDKEKELEASRQAHADALKEIDELHKIIDSLEAQRDMRSAFQP